MKKKYYAVKKGRNPGIYDNWPACRQEVIGYKGALYKSFNSKEEAQTFLDEDLQNKSPDKKDLVLEKSLAEMEMMAYVDGSYCKKTEEFGYGVVCITNQREWYLQGKGKNEFSQSHNIAGELFAAQKAIKEAVRLNMRKLTIIHDYEGIRAWAKKEWKANVKLTQEYVEFFDAYSKQITVDFIKVKSHSHDYYNDKADELAKKAIGIL